MILIAGQSQYSTVEKLVESLNEIELSYIASLKDAGYSVNTIELPSHIKTPEQYGMMLLDLWAELYLNQNGTLN